MARRAVIRLRALLMTIHAPFHLYRRKWFCKGGGHRTDVAMANRALDFPELDMPAVGEIGIVRHAVNLLPLNWNTIGNVFGNFAFFQIFSLSVRMAIATRPNVRDGGPRLGFRVRVAIQTRHARFGNVLLVVIGDGLQSPCELTGFLSPAYYYPQTEA